MAMLRGLVTYLLENGRIETTVTRAKEVRSLAEKYITIAKENTLNNKRKAFAFITKEDVVKKLFDEIAPVYKDVAGGYTRIIKIGPRRGDAAEMCIIELVDPNEKQAAVQQKKTKPAAEKPVKNRAERVKKSQAAEEPALVAEEAAVAEKDVLAVAEETQIAEEASAVPETVAE
jgi:large subunit ribosomal protein L17